MPSPIENAYQVLTTTQTQIAEALGEQSQTDTGIFITTSLTKLVNKLAFQLGVSANQATAPQTFEPVTNFMGEDIVRTAPPTAEQLQGTPTQRELYLAEVEALQSTFRTRETETLIKDLSNKQEVLRGVAKRAGLEDFQTGTINIDFIERIKAGLDAIDQTAKEEEAINQELTAIGDEVTGNAPTIPVNAYDGNPSAPTGFNDDVQDVQPNPVPDAVVNKELDPAPAVTDAPTELEAAPAKAKTTTKSTAKK